jgi:hypothetical protein
LYIYSCFRQFQLVRPQASTADVSGQIKKMKQTITLIFLVLLFSCHSEHYVYNQDDFQVYSQILSKCSNSLVIPDLFIQDRYQLKEFLNKKRITSDEKKYMNQQLRYLIRHEIKYKIDSAKFQNKTITEIEIDSIFKISSVRLKLIKVL